MAARYLALKRGDLQLCCLAVPQRPYKNLEDFRKKQCHFRASQIDDTSFWPCLPCSANGWVYYSDSKPCPVESNKDRERIKCQFCCGTGRGEKEYCQMAYRRGICEWERERDEFNYRLDCAKYVLAKLSDTDVKILLSVIGKNEKAFCLDLPENRPKVVKV